VTTISFDAIAEGGVIRIPAKYAKHVKSKVKVVLFPENEDTSGKSSRIPFYGFNTTEYSFDRDEANGR
jgi:hypothetical protein